MSLLPLLLPLLLPQEGAFPCVPAAKRSSAGLCVDLGPWGALCCPPHSLMGHQVESPWGHVFQEVSSLQAHLKLCGRFPRNNPLGTSDTVETRCLPDLSNCPTEFFF